MVPTSTSKPGEMGEHFQSGDLEYTAKVGEFYKYWKSFRQFIFSDLNVGLFFINFYFLLFFSLVF